jgi:DNA polymerase-3 subunit beta
LDLYAVTDLEVDGQEDGAVTIPGRKFTDIVRELPEELITLSTENEQSTLHCGRRTYRFLGMNTTDFPSLPATTQGNGVEVPIAALLRAFQHTAFAVSTDEARPNLQGALLQLGPSKMRLVASDSHRLVRYDLTNVTSDPMEVILPLKAMQLLQRTLPASDGTAQIELCGNYLSVIFASTRVLSRLLEGPFPDYEKVMPRDNALDFSIPRQDIARALRRVRLFCNSSTQQVRLALDNGALSISTNAPEVGDAIETLDIDYSKEPMEIGFNATYLMEVLKHIDSDSVRFRLGGPTKAGIIEPLSVQPHESYISLIMPLRLNTA